MQIEIKQSDCLVQRQDEVLVRQALGNGGEYGVALKANGEAL